MFKRIAVLGLFVGALVAASPRAEAAPIVGALSLSSVSLGTFSPVLPVNSLGVQVALGSATALDFTGGIAGVPTPGVPGAYQVDNATGDFAALDNTMGVIDDFTFSGAGNLNYPAPPHLIQIGVRRVHLHHEHSQRPVPEQRCSQLGRHWNLHPGRVRSDTWDVPFPGEPDAGPVLVRRVRGHVAGHSGAGNNAPARHGPDGPRRRGASPSRFPEAVVSPASDCSLSVRGSRQTPGAPSVRESVCERSRFVAPGTSRLRLPSSPGM